MARVRGPLLSFEAAGTVEGALTFMRRRGQNIVARPRRVWRQNFTDAQILQSYAFISLAQIYKQIDNENLGFVWDIAQNEFVSARAHFRRIYPLIARENLRARPFLDGFAAAFLDIYDPLDFDPVQLNWNVVAGGTPRLVNPPTAIERPGWRGGPYNIYKKDALLSFWRAYAAYIPGFTSEYLLAGNSRNGRQLYTSFDITRQQIGFIGENQRLPVVDFVTQVGCFGNVNTVGGIDYPFTTPDLLFYNGTPLLTVMAIIPQVNLFRPIVYFYDVFGTSGIESLRQCTLQLQGLIFEATFFFPNGGLPINGNVPSLLVLFDQHDVADLPTGDWLVDFQTSGFFFQERP